MLTLRGIHQSFDALPVLKGVSFSMQKGEALGIFGESGCGKSTLMKIVSGLLRPDQGEVLFTGDKLGRQMIFQNPFGSLDPRLTVLEILREPFYVRGLKNKKKLAGQIEALLESVDLSLSVAHRLPHELSGGECQRVAIARALSCRPQVLICDEALASLDMLVRARLLNLFLKLNQERSLALLFVSHDKNAIRHLCHRALVMNEGRLHPVDVNFLQ